MTTPPHEQPTDALRWPTEPDRAALVLDFDGTLAPIVEDPASSHMPEATGEVLSRIARQVGRMAIVSGRPAAFLQREVPVADVALVGLYGLEQVRDGAVVPDERIAAHADALARARRALTDLIAEWPGTELEDKGNATAIHWRRAEDPAAAAAAVTARVEEIAAAEGLWTEPGKMVLEVRPPVAADKGTAVLALVEGFDEVAFAGDDLGDLPALQAVRDLGGLAITVDHGEETDPRLREVASHHVQGTEGMFAWLEALADRLDRR